MSNVLRAAPAGPIAAKFAKSKAFIAGIMGPVGSGKTTACVQRCVHIGLWQNAVRDGNREGRPVRRAKIAVVRDTYPNLDATVIETWHRWFPADKGEWVGGAPRTHHLEINLGPTAGILILDMIFVAIGDKRVEDVLRGLEVTAIWLNEADRLSFEVLKYALGRVGRYPGALEGGCAWSGVFVDFNAPDSENWTYKLFVDNELDPKLMEALREELGEDVEIISFFRQPGGREPGAENLHNLPKGYYTRQMIGATADYIRRMIDNEFGAVRDGQPVYPEFKDTLHVSPIRIVPINRRMIRVGIDGGLTPAAVFKQVDSLGQHRILRELAVFPIGDEIVESVGPTRFGRALREFIRDEFTGFTLRDFEFISDPATKDGTDDSENEQSWLQIVERELNGGKEAWASTEPEHRIRIRPASTNVLTKRLEAVRKPMMYLVEGGRPAFLLDPSCKVLRKGFNSGYHFKRVASGGSGTGRFDSKPAKNMFSHVQDACQYAFDEGGTSFQQLPAAAHPHAVGMIGHSRGMVMADNSYSQFGE